MPKPDRRDTPDAQSRENAISSRAVEQAGAEYFEGIADDLVDRFKQAHAAPGYVEGSGAKPPVFKPVNYRKTGPKSVEVVSTDTSKRETQEQGDGRGEVEAIISLDELHQQTRQAMGDVPATAASIDPAEPVETCAREAGEAIMRRLMKDRRWREISGVRDEMMRDAKKRLPDLEDRRAWVYAELDRMYPPVQEKPAETDMGFVGIKGVTATKPIYIGNSDPDSGQIQGLSDLPKDWPELPANAALQAEIGWVQANRLFMVEERLGQATRVRLERAASPAPSRAALGWLETSIRSYAKFVDVAAKVSGGADDEGAVLRRERKSVDEVKALLREMEEAEGTCPSCGRAFAGS